MDDESATSSVETGKCRSLEDSVELPEILHGKDMGSRALEAGATNYASA